MKAVILAGGLGTRMNNEYKDIPKPLIRINGKPVLQHQIEVLSKEGINDFVLVVGYMSDKIENYFGDGSKFGVKITYFREESPLGTAGALFRMEFDDDFLLCNGDLIFDFSLSSMSDFHKNKNALATLFCHPNSHPYDSTLITLDDNSCVTDFIPPSGRYGYYSNLCNAGIQIISPELLSLFDIDSAANLDKDIFLPALKTKRIFAYKSHEYVHDMGTPERLKSVENDVTSGMVTSLHHSKKQKAIFLDRDGTINTHKGYITSPDEIELLPGVDEAIKAINKSNYLAIVITNQPVIARGECTFEELESIHNKLESLLGEKGAYLDNIYYCPHHPDSGFENEIIELKVDCNCRKPSPGLLIKAAEDYNIDLKQSYMVGDSARDVLAGKNAGCISVLLSDKTDTDIMDARVFSSLYDFVKTVFGD